MPKLSAGLLLYRRREDGPEVFLVHPGGPFWSNKDAGAWSIPKGEPAAGEDLLIAARRKMAEETGFAPPGPFVPLEPRRQKAGKLVHAWAVEGDCDPA
ncbi:MAG: NUDIX hydrolase, partial [Rhodospirillaceae bacterium]|nr:NUDIX hydrolase [Rhodospirillaceae bacterium]